MAGRVTVTETVSIDRPPAEVFAYVSDVSKHGEWSPKPMRVEGVAPGPVKTGDSFTSFGVIPGDKNHRNDVTVAESTPPTRLVFDSTEKGEHFINTFELQASGAGTTLTRTMDVPKPGPPLSLMMPLIKSAFIQPDVKKGLGKLKANLEHA
jgi:uncharacterized protein YndB with AHSA1/START domain